MKINKFKKVGKSKYKVMFDNDEITLYEDVILKYDLLIIKNIDIELLEKVLEENKFYDAYYNALNYIEIKMRNKKEIEKYLSKREFDKKIIDNVINKLESLNLLNNKQYITAFVNDKINLSNDGPYKIKKLLIECEIPEDEIDIYLDTIDESVWSEKLDKIINKKMNLMNNKSYYMFITKLKNDLFNLGYDKYMIDEKISSINYESNAFSKDLEKAKKKYDDKNKIVNYLLRKGYTYDEINNNLK